MKSFLFPVDRRQPQDEEEGSALVPPPSPSPAPNEYHQYCTKEDDGRTRADDDDGHDPAAVHHQQLDDEITTAAELERQAKPAWAWWWSWTTTVLMPTRSVVLVIGGLIMILALLLGTTTGWWPIINLDYYSSSSFLVGGGSMRQHRPRPPHHALSPAENLIPIPFTCGGGVNQSITTSICRRRPRAGAGAAITSSSPSPSPSSSEQAGERPAGAANTPPPGRPPRCPEYFRHIHSDLSPWRETGITREAVERGRGRAAFRLVVVGGRAYVETYHRVFQTRDTFTQWGIAQLLARYPGRVPDLDLMFNCEDMPEVRAADFPVRSDAPPLFRYCKDDATLDIVFPDWSFWGWPELNIRPWAPLLQEMARQQRRLPWPEREPYAYWKGNPGVSPARADLLRCNKSSSDSKQKEWNARVFRQDWDAAIRGGFKGSNLAEQCRYRYKIFVQGRSWSVSEKYILACDSPMLLVTTPFKDFFSRGLVAGEHYWPIDPARKCPAIKFAVDWGNAHPKQAQRMATQGSGFAREDMSMDYVYDYMLHLLTEYAKLLRYKPTVPDNAVELCPETIACPPAQGRERDLMMESRERYVADYEPCTLPPPFTADELREMAHRDQQVRRKVHKMMIEDQEKHT